MSVLVYDNYDSFTYNLVHLLESFIDEPITVALNDSLSLQDIEQFDSIVISPGPGLPTEVKTLLPLIRQFSSTKKILGICLGQQAIAEAFGGTLYNLPQVYHGVSTNCFINKPNPSRFFFNNLFVQEIEVGRYHSWAVEAASLPSQLKVTAIDNQGTVMAIEHESLSICGLQFHPESILTPLGKHLIETWYNNK